MDAGSGAAVDEGLSRLADRGPEYGGTLSNHGPMVVEALGALGRDAAVHPWLDDYLPLLEEQPHSRARIDPARWREALGDPRRVGDWQALLRHEAAELGWATLLRRWWPRLLPGVAAGATHGVIRTAHAARSLAVAQTGPRVAELVDALAYWAARHQRLPGPQVAAGDLGLDAAVPGVLPTATPAGPGLIRDRLAGADDVPGLEVAVSRLRAPATPEQGCDDLVLAAARLFLTHGRAWPTAYVHAITAPAAAASVLDLLDPATRRHTHGALWQLVAVLHAVHGAGVVPEALPEPDDEPADPTHELDDLADRAVADGDEHAVKLTEACLRQWRRTPDPVLLRAAARGLDLLPEPGDG